MSFGNSLLIYNPISGPEKSRIPVGSISENLKKAGISFTTLITEYHGHASEYLKNSQTRFDTIICSGGDGSINEIINALDDSYTPAIVLLPQGTGNDLYRSLYDSSSKDKPDSLNFSLYKNSILLDIGKTEGIYSDGTSFSKKFCNAIGVGLDSLIAKYVSELKKRNHFSYIFSLLKAILHYQAIKGTITTGEGKIISNDFILLSVNNGKTSGGGFYLAPDAVLDDQKLDFCFINKLNKFRIIINFPKVLGNKIKEFKEVELYQSDSYVIVLDTPYHLHIDGEMESKPVKELKVSLSSQKIKFYKH